MKHIANTNNKNMELEQHLNEHEEIINDENANDEKC